MRVLDLDPRFYSETMGRHGMGMTFDCPHCVRAGLEDGARTRLAIWFQEPLDGGAPATEQARECVGSNGQKRIMPLFGRVGQTFDILTINPSVNAEESGHWHGWIKNGEIQ